MALIEDRDEGREDGDTFDTKKAKGEKDLQISFQNYISNKIPFTTSIHVCSFNQDDKNKIKTGFKNVYSNDEIFTGQELCNLLGINYQEIINLRKEHQEKNLKFFLNALLKIDSVKKFLKDS